MIELGNPPPRPPEVWKATGIATGDFTTRSPARSPARSSTAASPGKIPPCGAGNSGGESRTAPGFDAFVAKADFVRRTAPRRGGGPVLRTARALLWASRTGFATRRRSGGNPHVGERIKQAWINSEALALNDPCFRRNCDLPPNCRDEAAGDRK